MTVIQKVKAGLGVEETKSRLRKYHYEVVRYSVLRQPQFREATQMIVLYAVDIVRTGVQVHVYSAVDIRVVNAPIWIEDVPVVSQPVYLENGGVHEFRLKELLEDTL